MSKSVGGGHIASLVLGAGAVALLVGASLVNVQNHDDAQVRAEQSASPSPDTAAESPSPSEPRIGDNEEFDSVLERIESGGAVWIGLGEWAPYAEDVKDRPRGFFPELARVVFTNLGASRVEFVYESVHSGEYAHNRLERDTSRQGTDVLILPNDLQSACSDAHPGNPVTENLSAFLVEEGNPQGIEDFSDFSDGSLVLGAPLTRNEHAQIDVDRSQLVLAPLDEASEMVSQGEVDGYFEDSVRLRSEIQQESDLPFNTPELEVTDPIPNDQLSYSGFAFPSDEDDLREAVDETITEMRADGRLLEIGEPWGITDAEITPGVSTAEELCDGQ